MPTRTPVATGVLVEGLAHVIALRLGARPPAMRFFRPHHLFPGISSEGSAVRSVALRYSEIRRILLCCIPNSVGDNLPPSRSSPGVSKLRAGATSPSPLGQRAAVRGREAEPLHLYEVPDCDHHFSGTTNGVILSKGFLWASGRTPAGRLDTNIIRGE